MTLPPWLGATVAWSLLLAYVATASSVMGGFYHYANVVLHDATGQSYSAVLLAMLVAGVSIWIAYRDVEISARLMLWIEAASVSVIVIVVVLLLFKHGWHVDSDQLRLRGVTGSGLRLGLVLALFSFVGFESATTLGAGAPQSAEDDSARRGSKRDSRRRLLHRVLLRRSFRDLQGGPGLGTSQDPMHVVAQVSGAPMLGLLIDFSGVLVSTLRLHFSLHHGGRAGVAAVAPTVWRTIRLRATHTLRIRPASRAVVITGVAAMFQLRYWRREGPAV